MREMKEVRDIFKNACDRGERTFVREMSIRGKDERAFVKTKREYS